MASSNQFSVGGFLDDLSSGAGKALSIWGQFDDARDSRKLRSKELDNQAKYLSIQVAEIQKEREMSAADAARSFATQENLYKVANVMAIGAVAGVGGWALAKVVKSFKGR